MIAEPCPVLSLRQIPKQTKPTCYLCSEIVFFVFPVLQVGEYETILELK